MMPDFGAIARGAPLASFPICGLLLTGSYARREACETSDVDLLALSESRSRWRKYYRHEPWNVDLFVMGVRDVERSIEKRDQPLLQMVATAIVLDDPCGRAQRLVDAAVRRYREGPAPPDMRMLLSFRHRVTSIIDKARGCADEVPHAVVMLLCAELKVLSDIYLASVGRWNVAEKYITREIEKSDPDLARAFAVVAGIGTSAPDRIEAFTTIVDRVLERYGGPLRYVEVRDHAEP